MGSYSVTNNHKLEGSNVIRKDCPKNTRPFDAGMPDSIVLHYTGGSSGESSANYLCKNGVKASAHLVIDRSGDVFQLVPFDIISWHAGESSYNGRSGYNQYSIGIEVDNAGMLQKAGAKFVSWFGRKYDADEVLEAVHSNESVARYWQMFTEAQIDAVTEICAALIDRYAAIKEILGHHEIAPGRKIDPGPAFPLDQLRQRLLNNRDAEKQYIAENVGAVSVPYLNIRELPGIKSKRIAEALKEGTLVTVLDEHEGWYKVRTEIEGWVASDYIDFR
jgi:N-acetylmuramoyl-L-alanine amidase